MFYPNGGPHGIGNHGVCPACVDMPWLRGWHDGRYLIYDGTKLVDGVQFKPDRSTVMRWCQIHQSAALNAGVNCYRQLHESEYGEPLDGDCDVVWIERPTPLKEAA